MPDAIVKTVTTGIRIHRRPLRDDAGNLVILRLTIGFAGTQSREIRKGNDILKGMIVCGYPGVGKSSVGAGIGWIDLDSSLFSQWQSDDTNYDWVAHYVHVATELAKQGFTVLLSTHIDVIELLKNLEKIPVVIICPKLEMKEAWSKRLQDRFENDPSDKNARAWKGAIQYWDKKIQSLLNSGFPVYQLESLDYDLRDYILQIGAEEQLKQYESSRYL